MAETTRISAETAKFLRSFQALLKSAQLYTLAHPQAAGAFGRCVADLRPVVREAPLTVSVADGRLLVNAQPVEEGLTSQALVQFLSQHSLLSLTFERDPNAADFRALIDALSVPVAQGQSTQHIEAKLRDAGVQSIKLNAIRYVATTVDEERQSEEAQLIRTLLGDVLRPEQAERIGGMLQDPRKTVQLLSAALMAKYERPGLDLSPGAGGVGGSMPGWSSPTRGESPAEASSSGPTQGTSGAGGMSPGGAGLDWLMSGGGSGGGGSAAGLSGSGSGPGPGGPGGWPAGSSSSGSAGTDTGGSVEPGYGSPGTGGGYPYGAEAGGGTSLGRGGSGGTGTGSAESEWLTSGSGSGSGPGGGSSGGGLRGGGMGPGPGGQWASPGGSAPSESTASGTGHPPGTASGPPGSGGGHSADAGAGGVGSPGAGGEGGGFGGGGVVGGVPGLPGGLGTGAWGPLTDSSLATMLSENEVVEMVRLLMRLGGQVSGAETAPQASLALRETVQNLDAKPAAVLVNLLAQVPSDLGERNTAQMLVDLAEKLAIRYAIAQLERGAKPAEATRQLINRLAQQIIELRKGILSRDLKLREAGVSLESYPEELDRKFWLSVTPSTRTRILRSPEAWAIPVKNIRLHLEDLLANGKEREVRFILHNCAACLASEEAEARRRVAVGLPDLLDLVQRVATPDLLKQLAQVLLDRLEKEATPAISKPIGAMLGQIEEMAWRRSEYEIAQQILAAFQRYSVEPSERGRNCATLLEEMTQDKKFGDRLQSVITSHSPDIRRALQIFSLLPEKTIHLAIDLADRESNPLRRQTIAELIGGLGKAAAPVLRRMLVSDRRRTVMTALEWLERGHPESILEALPLMVPKQDPQVQYAALTAVIHRDVPGRVRILIEILPHLHKYVQPRVIDELGMLRENDAVDLLVQYATSAKFADEPYLRVKAIEALGRIGAERSVEPLIRILSERGFLSSKHPPELRICAAEALERIGGEHARQAVAKFIRGEAAAEIKSLPLTEESSWVDRRGGRPRKYRRMNLEVALPAILQGAESRITATVRNAGLGGAFFESSERFPVGTVVTMTLGSGLRPIHGIGMVRSVRPAGLGVEFVSMDLKERERWRKFLRARAATR